MDDFGKRVHQDFELVPANLLQHTVIRRTTASQCAEACMNFMPAIYTHPSTGTEVTALQPSFWNAPPSLRWCRAIAFEPATMSCALYSKTRLQHVGGGVAGDGNGNGGGEKNPHLKGTGKASAALLPSPTRETYVGSRMAMWSRPGERDSYVRSNNLRPCRMHWSPMLAPPVSNATASCCILLTTSALPLPQRKISYQGGI